jgi:hypothetical protein
MSSASPTLVRGLLLGHFFNVALKLGTHELEQRVPHGLEFGELAVLLGPVGGGVQPILLQLFEEGSDMGAELGRGDLQHESMIKSRAETR